MAVKHSPFDRFLLILNGLFLTVAVLLIVVPLVTSWWRHLWIRPCC